MNELYIYEFFYEFIVNSKRKKKKWKLSSLIKYQIYIYSE